MSKTDVKVKIEKHRVYREDFTGYGEPSMRLVSPTEYAVVRGDETLARIIKSGDGWRVVIPTEQSKFGAAVSPVGLNRFTRVKEWAIRKRGGGSRKRPIVQREICKSF